MRRPMNQKVAVSVVFVLAMFVNIMDITIVNVALPQLGQDLHSTPSAVSAVSIGYLVSLAVVIPASGWMGDRFGTKRILLSAIVVFTLSSALCGAAQTMGQLVAFRVLQGVGGGMLAPVGMAMLFSAFPPAERVRASSILTTPTALAPAIGPVLGGLLVTHFSWRWVFYVNLPIGAVALAFGILFLEPQPSSPPRPFDVPGFALSGIGFASLMFGVSEGPQRGWASPLVLTTITAGVVLVAALVRQQLTTAHPLLGLRLFSDRLFRSTLSVSFLGAGAFLGTLYVVALFFQDGLGLSALQSGLSTFPEAVGVMVGAQSASRLLRAGLGPRRVIVGGMLSVATTLALMTLVGGRGELWGMRGLMFLLGISIAHLFIPSQVAAFARIAPADTGGASTLFNALRQLGAAGGVALFSTALALVGGSHHALGLHAFHMTFLVASAIALLAALLALTIHDEDVAAPPPSPPTTAEIPATEA